MNLFKKLKAVSLKAIQTTKQGENGFKKLPDGSYFNAFDAIPETLKFVDDIVTNCDLNQDHKRLSYGINFESEAYYNKDTKIYDIEGPKSLMNGEQMADWYVKQVKEHPHLVYLEDPFQEARGY